MLTSKFLKDIMTEARPIIERQLDDAELIAGLRDVFTAQGGDWGALKALIKSQVQDERDEAGEGKRIRKLRDRSGNQLAYADMLGLGNMNEENSFAEDEGFDPSTGEVTQTQAAPQPASDLTAPQPLGQVANHSQAKTSEDGGATGEAIEQPSDGVTGDVSRPSVGGGTDAPLSFADRIKKLRPLCQQPTSCRSSGGKSHCYACTKASNEAGSAA